MVRVPRRSKARSSAVGGRLVVAPRITHHAEVDHEHHKDGDRDDLVRYAEPPICANVVGGRSICVRVRARRSVRKVGGVERLTNDAERSRRLELER